MNYTGIIGLTIFSIITVALILIIRKKKNTEAKYDEMQLKYIGNAYKYAYITAITMLFGGIIVAINTGSDISPYVFSGFLTWIIFISVMVFSLYSIWHDSFFGISENWDSYLRVCIILSALFIGLFILDFKRHYYGNISLSTIADEFLFRSAVNAALAISHLSFTIMIIVKKIRNAKEES